MKTTHKMMIAVVIGLAGLSNAHAGEEEKMTIFKSPWCGCCEVWAEAMKSLGYNVTISDLEDLTQIKKQAGVPDALEACHTAVLSGYVLEGHVPVAAIEKLTSERPSIRGIAVPGMPQGSLGMGENPEAAYAVFAFYRDPAAAPTVYYTVGE